jgi:hypothetical protein
VAHPSTPIRQSLARSRLREPLRPLPSLDKLDDAVARLNALLAAGRFRADDVAGVTALSVLCPDPANPADPGGLETCIFKRNTGFAVGTMAVRDRRGPRGSFP